MNLTLEVITANGKHHHHLDDIKVAFRLFNTYIKTYGVNKLELNLIDNETGVILADYSVSIYIDPDMYTTYILA